jgi:tripartite-type tricarboxylate transporter receptor subunit TctC
MFLVIPPIKGHLEAGRLRALATLNDKRLPQFPDLPTMTDIGLPKVTNAIWFGYLAPAKTPQPIVDKLVGALGKLQSDAALVKRVSEMGADLKIVGPSEFGKVIAYDRERYGKVVADGNLAKQN